VDEPREQSGPIAVYGATGYTGRLVAAELHRRGAELILAGRSAPKLQMVAEDLGGGLPTRAVPLDDEAGLRDLLGPCAAVIACAGPFQRHGEPVVAAAVASRTHYVDTTGEQLFMRTVFDRYDTPAAEAGVALVSAMGFDYAPGDMIAALTAEGMGPLEEVAIAYAVSGWDVIGPRATRGTARSALGILAGDELEWTDGELRAATGGIGQGTWDFPAPVGHQRMIRYPAGEHLTVPRHVDTRSVRTMLTASTLMPHPRLAGLAPVIMPPLRMAVRSPLRRGIGAAISRLPEGPSEKARRRARFMVVCEAGQGTSRRRGMVTGADVYAFTARATAEGAFRLAAPGYERRGALAPSQAFDPRGFLDSLGRFGVAHEITSA